MTFEEILPYLKRGYCIRRKAWSDCFCIYIISELYKNEWTPIPNESILLIEAERRGLMRTIIHRNWHPHAGDFFANDWYCVELSLVEEDK